MVWRLPGISGNMRVMNAGTFLKMHQKSSRYWWYCAKETLVDALITGYAPVPGNSAGPASGVADQLKIIDLGCGTGSMFGVLSKKGRLVGLEPSRDALTYAATQNRAMLVQAGSCAIPFGEHTFDIVTMFDSLEHIENDLKALEEAHKIIRKNGLLLITVPAFEWLISWREKQLGHKRRYSKTSLVNTLNQAGFHVSFVRYMYAALFPLLVVKVIKDRLFPVPKTLRSDIAMPPEPWNTVLTRWFCGEAHICRKWGLPFGTSLVCVAHPVQESNRIRDAAKRSE
jgi:SAM-dependent methyltransferase